jgi:predicted nucleotidyltransferase
MGSFMRIRLGALCDAHAIQVLYAFGSRAREALEFISGQRGALTQAGSDLDIGVKPAAALGIKEKASIALELEEFFSVPRVDLISIPEADPFLAANIIRGERLYMVDEHAADEYELYILRRAGDLAPLERERLSLLERR